MQGLFEAAAYAKMNCEAAAFLRYNVCRRVTAFQGVHHVYLAGVLESADASMAYDAVWTPDQRVTWPALQDEYQQRHAALEPLQGERLALIMRGDASSMAWLAACEKNQCDVFLFDESLDDQRRHEWSELLETSFLLTSESNVPIRCASVPRKAADRVKEATGSVTILTSGTTGRPKAVQHSWDRLCRPVRRTPSSPPQRWLLAFRPHLYAGLQVILQSLLNRGTLIIPRSDDSPTRISQLMAQARVEFASATPSYWRRLLLSGDQVALENVPLQQITLGGEVVDQPILDRLSAMYPAARLVHIYATTELGRCFSVADRRAGFPRGLLDQPTLDGVEMKIEESQLYVKSANAMNRYATPERGIAAASPDHWFGTGDLVRVENDRVFFVGRENDLINVGGNKVSPVTVEDVVRRVPGVADVRVYGHASSIAGQLVACQIVAEPQQNADKLLQKVREACARDLSRIEMPRMIELVPQLTLSAAGKVTR